MQQVYISFFIILVVLFDSSHPSSNIAFSVKCFVLRVVSIHILWAKSFVRLLDVVATNEWLFSVLYKMY